MRTPRWTLVRAITASAVLAYDTLTGACSRIHPDRLAETYRVRSS